MGFSAVCDFKDLGKTVQNLAKFCEKNIRYASYKALEQTAEQARTAVIKQYPKKFKDENGIVKNKGIPQQLTKSKVDKTDMSIMIYMRKNDIDEFMKDQEYGGERTGKDGKSRAVPTLETMQKGRNSRGRMKQAYSIKKLMEAALKSETSRAKKAGKPKPFLLTTSSGHHVLAQRLGRDKNPVRVLYHFDKKVKVRPRWDFVKTVEGVTVHNMEKNFLKNLEKSMNK